MFLNTFVYDVNEYYSYKNLKHFITRKVKDHLHICITLKN